MDLIRELKDVRFELNLRGYDCDAVDAFLAKVRSEVAELETDRENAKARVASLEEQVATGESDTEGTLRRTLILAQRLADETVADARQSATETTEAAETQAAETIAEAEAEAARILEETNEQAEALRTEAQQELEDTQAAAARLAEESAADADRTRSTAAEEAERLLADAEVAGAERVAGLESSAREEVARMREPIREEVRQLEETRARLLDDIAALDEHLVEQRRRVRTAVDSLRAGMSGSIEDLERVAADEDLMSPAPTPSLSGATGADVAIAPDIDIADAVQETTPPAPPVADLAARAAEATAAAHAPAEGETVEEGATAEPAAFPGAEEIGAVPGESVVDTGDATVRMPVVDSGEEVPPAIEDLDLGADAPGADVIDLDAQPSPLFGTDVAEQAEVVEVAATDAELVDAEDDGTGDGGFIARFAAAIGDLPVRPEG